MIRRIYRWVVFGLAMLFFFAVLTMGGYSAWGIPKDLLKNPPAGYETSRTFNLSQVSPVVETGPSSEVWGVISKEIYIVRKGDTLYEIGKKAGKSWKGLAELNELYVDWRDGVPYVWLKPGQVLMLEPPDERLNPLEIATYFETTKIWMQHYIFKMAGIKSPAASDTTPQIVIGLNNDGTAIPHLKSWIEWFEHQGRWRTVEEIYHEILARMDEFPFKTGEKYWEDHRKMAVLLMVLLDVESDGYNKRGKHGEAGKWQIMPATYLLYKGFPHKEKAWQAVAVDILMTDNLEGLRCAMNRLSKKDNIKDALAYYNGSGPGAKKYANRVYPKYLKKLKEAMKYEATED